MTKQMLRNASGVHDTQLRWTHSSLRKLQVCDGIDNPSRSIRKSIDHLARRHAGQDEHGFESGFSADAHIGIHAIADHDRILGMFVEMAQCGAHHQRIRLADEVGLHTRGRFDEGRNRTAGRHQAAFAGATLNII